MQVYLQAKVLKDVLNQLRNIKVVGEDEVEGSFQVPHGEVASSHADPLRLSDLSSTLKVLTVPVKHRYGLEVQSRQRMQGDLSVAPFPKLAALSPERWP